MKKLKKSVKILSVLLLLSNLLISCVSTNSNCPKIINYNDKDQEKLADYLEKVDDLNLQRWLMDYHNLRQELRIIK